MSARMMRERRDKREREEKKERKAAGGSGRELSAAPGAGGEARRWQRCALWLMVGVVSLLVGRGTVYADQPSPAAVRIAVIGDYGDGSRAAADVATLVKSWRPDIIVTTGDNNYPDGAAETMDGNVGRFYHEFIAPYVGQHGAGADVNHFFPTLGNHDWNARKGRGMPPQPYLDYFTLPEGPGQERYYDVVWGPVHIFAVDSDYREPDGSETGTAQWRWLRERLTASTAPWKLVVLHEPPYSSGRHGSAKRLRWPFREWGATAVLSGHDHTYERILVDGLPYFVNGLGGSSRYRFLLPVTGSEVRYNADSGAMLIEAGPADITFRFITQRGEEIDVYRMARSATDAPATSSPAPRATGLPAAPALTPSAPPRPATPTPRAPADLPRLAPFPCRAGRVRPD